MAQRDRTDIRTALKKKGFVEEGGDHYYYFFHQGGKRTHIWTKISRGSKYKTYDDQLLAFVKLQLKLGTKNQLLKLIDCEWEYAEYLNFLINEGVLQEENDNCENENEQN